MSLDRWQRVKAVFNSARDRPPAERESFLEDSCAQDAELLEEVRSLLQYEQDTQTTASGPARVEGERASTILGQRLGPYQLIREIGRGGMASVYLALRVDDQYRKRVAIKVVNRALGSEEVVHRFLSERQTLAVLDHPNIVKLLDGGSSTEGLVYLVMDYVEGMSITDYCDARRLTIGERLELFRTVCGAVHYAHQNLVIHRDLKPANILVSGTGTPKLLDFGIAKLLNPEFLEESWMTRSALHPMTPEYASPEQIRGEAVTTATDVYSLGVVLYELLTGRMPYSSTPLALSQLERIVSHEQPKIPSAIVALSGTMASEPGGGEVEISVNVLRGEPTSEKLSRRLKGDLDNIVLMALRKEPQHRYSSAEQLSEDLRHHLDGLPVLARKPTLLYRSGKFVQRNRPWVVVAGMILALLIAAVVVTSREARIANIERLHAEQRFDDVHELADSFLFEFDDSIKNLRGSTPARELVVRKALEYLNRLRIESEADTSLQMDLVRAYLKVGDIQGSPYTANLGDLKGALDTYTKGQQIALALSRSHQHDRNVQLLLAKTYQRVGGGQLFGGNPQRAATNLNRAVELLRPITSSEANVDAELVLINSYAELGDAYGHGSVVNLGQPGKALEFFQDALALSQNALTAHPENTSLREDLAIAETKIGDVLLGEGEWNGAVEHHRNALKEFTAIASSAAENATAKREVSVAESRLARSLWQHGDRREAIELDRKAQVIAEDLYAADPANMQAKFDLAVGRRNLSEELAATGNFTEAVKYFRHAIDLVSELAAADPANVERQAQLGEGLVSFGHLLEQSGRREEAQSQTRHGLEVDRSLAASKMATADQKLTYAYALLTCDPQRLRNPTGSLEFARQAEKMDPNDPDVLNVLASADFALGNVRQAAETEGQALTLISQHSGGDTFFSAKVIRANLARFTKALDASGRAEPRAGRPDR